MVELADLVKLGQGARVIDQTTRSTANAVVSGRRLIQQGSHMVGDALGSDDIARGTEGRHETYGNNGQIGSIRSGRALEREQNGGGYRDYRSGGGYYSSGQSYQSGGGNEYRDLPEYPADIRQMYDLAVERRFDEAMEIAERYRKSDGYIQFPEGRMNYGTGFVATPGGSSKFSTPEDVMHRLTGPDGVLEKFCGVRSEEFDESREGRRRVHMEPQSHLSPSSLDGPATMPYVDHRAAASASPLYVEPAVADARASSKDSGEYSKADVQKVQLALETMGLSTGQKAAFTSAEDLDGKIGHQTNKSLETVAKVNGITKEQLMAALVVGDEKTVAALESSLSSKTRPTEQASSSDKGYTDKMSFMDGSVQNSGFASHASTQAEHAPAAPVTVAYAPPVLDDNGFPPAQNVPNLKGSAVRTV